MEWKTKNERKNPDQDQDPDSVLPDIIYVKNLHYCIFSSLCFLSNSPVRWSTGGQ